MKKAILWIILLILLSAIIPITAGIKYDINTKETVNSDADATTSVELNDDEKDAVISNVMEYVTEEFDTECKKAVVALCKNNALVQKNNGLKPKATQVSKYSDSFYEELKEILSEDDTTISFNGDRVYIPIVKLCPGYIVECADYPYISSVACPWDLQHQNYNKRFDYPCGISINGLQSLCSSGLDCKYTLSHFLPQFTIS